MAEKKVEGARVPVPKMIAFILIALVGGTYLFTWVSGSSLFFEYKTLTTPATVVDIEVSSLPENLAFSIQYSECPGVIESINLGKRVLDAKAPKQLIEIRNCMGKIEKASVTQVSIKTRTRRLDGKKSGLITAVGACELPPLPTVLKMKDKARCPWM